VSEAVAGRKDKLTEEIVKIIKERLEKKPADAAAK
jgi:hypothetical protein